MPELTPDEELDIKINAAVEELLGYIFDSADTDQNTEISQEEFRTTLTNLLKSQIHIDETTEYEKKEGSGTSFRGIKQGSTVLDMTQIDNALASKSDIGHLHTASVITSGVLPTEFGGTGAKDVESNKALLGPISGEASEPTWRNLEVEDVPGMEKIDDISTMVLPVNSKQTTVNIPDVKVQYPGQTVEIDEQTITTYNNITEDKRSFVRFEDSEKVYLGGVELLARPNGEIRLSLVANDPWGGEATNTTFYVASNDKIAKNKHVYGVSNRYEFYKGIRPSLIYFGIRQGSETYTLSSNTYQDIIEIQFSDSYPKYTRAPIVLLSIHSNYGIKPDGTTDTSKSLAENMAGISVTSFDEKPTGFKIKIFKGNEALDGNTLWIRWVAFPGVYKDGDETYQDEMIWDV